VSQADLETLRAGYVAFTRGSWEGLFESADREFELTTAARSPSPGTYRGAEQVKRFFEDLFEPFEQVTAQPQKFFERDHRIAVLLLIRLRPKGSSAVVENRIGHLWTFRDGKALRLEIFPEREKALEAIGMSEQEARAEAA
jgi:ketosteroid isomerase-like protein